jgi:hypothetical protein
MRINNSEILFATVDNGVYDLYLGKASLDPIIKVSPVGDFSPAKFYNSVLDSATERYVCFVHSDVSCNGLKEAIIETIRLKPGYLYGVVGSLNGVHWSRKDKLFNLLTCDSCCIVVDREMGLRFDEENFDEYHLYVEALGMEANSKGIKMTTIALDAFYAFKTFETDRYFIHHSHTLNELGCSWGNYPKYKARLLAKWKRSQVT